jgi:segregation and condensation protein B
MSENEIPAAGEAPETEELNAQQIAEADVDAEPVATGEAPDPAGRGSQEPASEESPDRPVDATKVDETAPLERGTANEESGSSGYDLRQIGSPMSDSGQIVSSAGATEASGTDSGEAIQMEMDASDLLGDAGQPEAEDDARATVLRAVLEAVVYVMNEPMPAAQIAEALGRDRKEVEAALRELVDETSQPGRGLFIREVAGGFQMATKPEHHEAIRQFAKNLKQPLKLSQAALETLAVIAYKQPITLPEILEIRGVQGGGVLKTLIDRKLVTTSGRKQVIGRPMLYRTTKDFLTQFGLKDVNELPSLKEFEEIRRQSMADEEFSVMEPDPNQPAPASVEQTGQAEITGTANAESGSPAAKSANAESGPPSDESANAESASPEIAPLNEEESNG